MSDLTPKAKDIIAQEIIESTSKAFFAYVAARGEDFMSGRGSTLPLAFSAFTNEVWAQVVDDLAREREQVRGQ